MARINLKANPELMALLGADGDDLEAVRALNALAPEKVLMKWLNYQVQRVAPGRKEVTNFGAALKDCEVYAHLLQAVAPAEQQHLVASLPKAVQIERDPLARAQLIINTASELGVSQFRVAPHDIAKGNDKLNMGSPRRSSTTRPAGVRGQGQLQPRPRVPLAQVKEGGRAVRLEESGTALLGGLMAAGSGTTTPSCASSRRARPPVRTSA